ncbi:MAG: hypothetical protein AAF266_08815 [Planctomycetota bacterium]
MNCHDAQSLVGNYALGQLSTSQRRELEEHFASGCPECVRELAEMNDSLASLIETEPLLSPRDELKAAIFDRIDAGQATVLAGKDEPRAIGASRSAGWQLLAAGLAAIALGFAGHRLLNTADETANAQRLAMEAWQRQIAGTERELGLTGGTLVSLPLNRADQGVVSHVLTDRVADQLHVWTKPLSEDGPTTPNWVWVLDDEEDVLGNGPLEPKGRRLGAVIDISMPSEPTPCRLLLTREVETPGSQPSDGVIDRAAFEVR